MKGGKEMAGSDSKKETLKSILVCSTTIKHHAVGCNKKVEKDKWNRIFLTSEATHPF